MHSRIQKKCFWKSVQHSRPEGYFWEEKYSAYKLRDSPKGVPSNDLLGQTQIISCVFDGDMSEHMQNCVHEYCG